MINWLITMFTEWLMQICYFHSFFQHQYRERLQCFWIRYVSILTNPPIREQSGL